MGGRPVPLGQWALVCCCLGLATTLDNHSSGFGAQIPRGGAQRGLGFSGPPRPSLWAPLPGPSHPCLRLRSPHLPRTAPQALPTMSTQRRTPPGAAAPRKASSEPNPLRRSPASSSPPGSNSPPTAAQADPGPPKPLKTAETRGKGGGPLERGSEGQGEGAQQGGDSVEKGEVRRRRRRKVDPSIMREFEIKAEVLLREAGGRLSSDQFTKRWRFAYPMDPLAVYRQGRHISARQLVAQCSSDRIRIQPRPDVHRTACDFMLVEQQDAGARHLVSGAVRNRSASAMDWLSPEMLYIPSEMLGEWEERWEEEEEDSPFPAGADLREESVAGPVGPACEINVASEEHGRSVEEGLELMETMRASGITFGNLHSYSALLHGCARAAGGGGRAAYGEKAIDILRLMAEVGVEPDEEAYGHAVTACARSGKLFRAVDVLRQMKDLGMGPSRQLFNLVVDTCVREAQTGNSIAMEIGVRVLKMMREAGIAADAVRCFALMDTPFMGEWCTHCRLEVVKVLQEMGTEDSAVMEARRLLDRYNAMQDRSSDR